MKAVPTTKVFLLSATTFAAGLALVLLQPTVTHAGAASTIAAGGAHTCVVTTTGRAKCWGYNGNGQLGDGTTTNRDVPVNVEGDLAHRVVAMGAGGAHTCAILENGSVECWGDNDRGQLGDGTTTERHVPARVIGLNAAATSVEGGYEHTCALTSVGGVKCWGRNDEGQLGDGTTTERHTPVDVIGLTSGVTQITTGLNHTCALTQTETVKCWGDNLSGNLGDGTRTRKLTPTDVVRLESGVAAIVAGLYHTCSLMSDGSVKCWGGNNFYQLGHGTRLRFSKVPIDVVRFGNGTNISAGRNDTCTSIQSGTMRCWGLNDRGQLGDGTTTNQDHPVRVKGLSESITAIGAGDQHTCSLLQTGHVKCWGRNDVGQLGNGTTTDSLVPVRVVGF